jgi:hypothetical protein
MRPNKEPSSETKDEPNGIGMSSPNSTGVLTAETSKESRESKEISDRTEVLAEAEPEPEQKHHRHHGHKHHKRVRSKDKVKNKSSDQPERECTVM